MFAFSINFKYIFTVSKSTKPSFYIFNLLTASYYSFRNYLISCSTLNRSNPNKEKITRVVYRNNVETNKNSWKCRESKQLEITFTPDTEFLRKFLWCRATIQQFCGPDSSKFGVAQSWTSYDQNCIYWFTLFLYGNFNTILSRLKVLTYIYSRCGFSLFFEMFLCIDLAASAWLST